MATAPVTRDARELRWRLLRDLGSFVLKVGLEAIRDLVLIPLALLAGLAGLVLSPADPARFFRDVLRLGARFDDFLDLFGAAARNEPLPARATRVDDLVDGIEAVLRDQHQKGGVTAAAKDAIDRALDAVADALQDRPGPPPSRSS